MSCYHGKSKKRGESKGKSKTPISDTIQCKRRTKSSQGEKASRTPAPRSREAEGLGDIEDGTEGGEMEGKRGF